MKRICVFCGSKTGHSSVYKTNAVKLGEEMVRRKLGLVYGGGHVGLMGVIADSVLGCGGHVIGVIPQAMAESEVAHGGVNELHIVETMHQRKAKMADLSCGFIAMPGGFGTKDEFFEIVTWAQLGIHQKPVGLLNINGYFDPILTWLENAVREGFVKAANRQLFSVATEAAELLDRFENHTSTVTRRADEVPPP